MSVAFGNLRLAYETLKTEIDAAVKRALDSGWYVLGKEIEAFEREFAEYVGVRHSIGVGNGTDAIEIALRALGVGVGDEVITVSHTATFTALGIAATGAQPVFVDVVEPTLNMDPGAAARAVSPRTKAVVPVHLYGVPADLDALREAIGPEIPIVEDVAQAHGAELGGRRLGSLGLLGCFSFYPSKNLGALGDGGAITTNDDALAVRVRQLRNGGQANRYEHALAGVNSRLDELQAAILRAKLPHLDAMNRRRRAIAERYRAGLSELAGLVLPSAGAPGKSYVFHLYVVRCSRRDELRDRLAARGIGTQIHYPIPSHLQPAFASSNALRLPVTARICGEILSLPMYPELTDSEVDEVIQAVREEARSLAPD